jgi:tetratricopeptide (TPR) repeat protein
LLSVHPEATPAAGLLAQLLERRGETTRAAAVAQWSLQKPEPVPPDPWLSELLADVYDGQALGLKFEEYFKTGQLAQALPLLRRIEELEPRSPIPPLLRGWSEAQAHHDRAAAGQYRLALANGGDPEKICPYLVPCLLALGDVNGATELIAEYAAKQPDSLPLAKAQAEVALRAGDNRLARRLLEKILQREPYLYAENMSLARLDWTAGERAAAVPRLQRAALSNPQDFAARALLGEYFLAQGDPAAAIPPLEQAGANAPEKSEPRAHLAALLASAHFQAGDRAVEHGRFEAAAVHFEKAAQLAPTDLNVYAALASARTQSKQFALAGAALEKLAALQPDNPTIHLSWGDVAYQNGNHDEARQHWRKALDLLAPGDAELRRAVQQRLDGAITDETFR